MMDFRKAFLALALIGLAAAGTASAQKCTALLPEGGSGYVAVENTNDVLPLLKVYCDGGAVSGVTITLISNVDFTMARINNQFDATVGVYVGYQPNFDTEDRTSLNTAYNNTLIASFDFPVSAQYPSGMTTLNGFFFEGLRVDSSMLPSGSPVTIQAYTTATISSTSSTTSNTPPFPVAFVSPTNLTPVIVGALNQTACSGNLGKSAVPVATVTLQEAFPSAFKDAGDYAYTGSDDSLAQGMLIGVTFNNLVSGVNYYVPAVVKGNGSLSLTAYSSAGASSPATTTSVVGISTAAVLLTVASTPGSATIYYSVTNDSPYTVESANVTLYEIPKAPAFATSTQGGLVPIHQAPLPVTVSVSLANTGADYPVYSLAAPVLTGTQPVVAGSNGILLTCETTLLFHYVVNVSGFDTGFSLSNTSPATGGCFLNFFGSGAPSPSTTVPFSGGAGDVGTIAPGFLGAMVVACDYPGAQGFAFISDGLGTNAGVATSYVATVINNNGIPASPSF